MEITKTYDIPERTQNVEQKVKSIIDNNKELFTVENLKTAFSLIDLTTLNTEDTLAKGKLFCDNVNNFSSKYSGIPNVAAICVYPSLVSTIRENLKIDGVQIASVTAGFPASQTFISIKIAESKLAIKKGADEVDIVLSVGTFFEKDYETVFKEIRLIKNAIGDAHLKVILESGLLKSPELIHIASILSMEAGADFIKTSTGKLDPPATLEAVFVMTEAISDFYKKTGKKIGIKPAGGLSTSQDAIDYLSVVKHNLGDEWITNKLFRIGASRLAKNLVTDIIKMETGKTEEVRYF